MEIDEGRIEELLKEALVEVLEERRDTLFCGLVVEVLEDVALAHAIREGESTEPVSREDVFKLLEDKA
ncbi:MAG: hypothetical protein AB1611_16370 [bacterium]